MTNTWTTKELGVSLTAWVDVVRIDRTIGRDPRTDRDAQRAVTTRQTLMDELHGRALEEYRTVRPVDKPAPDADF